MVLAAAGLTPISPVTWVAPVVEIPDFARIAKLPVVPRTIGNGPAALASGTGAKTPVNMDITKDSTTSVARTLLMRPSPLGCAASIEDDGDVRGHKPTQILVQAEPADGYPISPAMEGLPQILDN
jgi:hypothetical protein